MVNHVCLGELCDECAMELAAQPDPVLEAELALMEANDPKLREAGDRLRDAVACLYGQPSRLGVHLRSLERQRLARQFWREASDGL